MGTQNAMSTRVLPTQKNIHTQTITTEDTEQFYTLHKKKVTKCGLKCFHI